MTDVGEDWSAADRGYEHGFQAPRRRQRALSIVTVAVFAAVGFLVYLMAKGPDEDAAARRLVDAAQAALPQDDMSVANLEAAASEIQRALDTSPGNAYVLEAAAQLQQRVAGQVGADIEQGELAQADEILTAADVYWPGGELFSETGELRTALDTALLERQIREEVAELIAAAQEALAGTVSGAEPGGDSTLDAERLDNIGAALQDLRQALDLDPENERAQSIRNDVRLDLAAATRRELDAGNPDLAQELLDMAEDEWRGDAGIADLRDELSRLLDELSAASELRRLIDLGERRLAADNLTTPAGDSAVAYFRQALALDPGNEQAAAGLAQVVERYALLIRDAVERGDSSQARSLLSRLADVAPQHAGIGPLQAQVEAAEEAARAAQAEQAQQAAAVAAAAQPSPPQPAPETTAGPVIADDEEGRLWSEVMNLCDETQLRRYIDAYPAGRHIEEAWRRRSACLEAR